VSLVVRIGGSYVSRNGNESRGGAVKEQNRPIRLKAIVPVATDVWNAFTLEECRKYKSPHTQIDVVNLGNGPKSLECFYDLTFSSFFTLQELEASESEGYDGVILYCFGDPAIGAAKEKLDIPVVGLMESSVHMAAMLGRRFSILAVGPNTAALATTEDRLQSYDMLDKCTSIRFLNVPVLQLESDKRKLETRALEEGRKAVYEDKADVIILGCGCLSLVGIDEVLKKELQVPIIVPGAAAIKTCEAFVSMGIAQSKHYYRKPPEKQMLL